MLATMKPYQLYMKKYLHSFLLVLFECVLSVCLTVAAQSSRIGTEIKSQKIEIIPPSVCQLTTTKMFRRKKLQKF
jgi:membrane glycosyltransferase